MRKILYLTKNNTQIYTLSFHKSTISLSTHLADTLSSFSSNCSFLHLLSRRHERKYVNGKSEKTIVQSSQLFCVFLVSSVADVFYLFPAERVERRVRGFASFFLAVIQAGAQGQSTGTRRDSLSSFSPPDLPQHFKSLLSRPRVALAEDICSPARSLVILASPLHSFEEKSPSLRVRRISQLSGISFCSPEQLSGGNRCQ